MTEPVQNAIQQANQAQAAANEIAVTVAETKIKDLTEILARHDAELAQMNQHMPQAEQQIAALGGKVGEMQKGIEPKKQAIDAAMKVYTETKAGADAAAAQVGSFHNVINRWLAAKENKTVIFVRSEVDQLKDTVESLKAEIPGLEAEIKKLTEQKAAAPPPPPEQIAKIDQQIATATKRLEEAKKELAASEPQITEKSKLLDGAWQKYLSLLPK